MDWKNKKVLVTGADGFIGSHLVELLINSGADVKAFTMYNSFNSWGWIDSFSNEMKSGIEIFTGDIRDENCVREAVEGCDIVFHLAALIAIPYSYYAPQSYVDTNVKGTLNVLQACRKLGTEKVIHTSTSEVYGTAQYVPIDEKHPLQGQSPYSASKIGADMIAESFWRSFDVPVAIARPFNTYGPRQSARAVIPTIITQLLSGNEKIMLGALNPTRDLNYVKDTVEGFKAIAESDKSVGQIMNISNGKEITIGELADKIIRLTGKEVQIMTEDMRKRPSNSEVERLCGNNAKIKEFTGWEPRYSLEDGLIETIEWIRDNIDKFKCDIYNR